MLSGFTRHLLKSANGLRVPAVARSVQRARLTYLSDAKFISLRDAIRQVKREKVPGDFIEYGIALGGSAIYIASELDGDRHFHGYDVFGMIPSPTEQDDEKSKARYETIRSGRSKGIGGDKYYGYQGDLFDKVCASFMDFGVPVDGERIVFHKGLFEDTVHFHPKSRIALAHLDCDWHDPVKFCLERTLEVLSPGGLMILDDYNDYGGCRIATDQFLAGRSDCRLIRTLPHAVVQRS
ncbi:asparagine synthase [Mesorhizobium helmanticense]|uniref:Asparagine synthase n=1 Tax=Mesorhizobium helmanticense TaxID=1776423 RepID=A0A2T4J2W9_9HYPH|nr:asparagine synthase [Mesorhizobium helmanticense]